MKYTYNGARREAARLRKLGFRSAGAVHTRYWSVDLWDWVPCWTVVL